jgi:ABC-type spermidine/putrescine transport system permease subunit I
MTGSSGSRKEPEASVSGVWYPRWFWPLFAWPATMWLAVLFLIPFYVVVSVAFGTIDFFRNPLPVYEPWYWSARGFTDVVDRFVGANPFYRPGLIRTLIYVPTASLICLLVGYGVAYYVARHAGKQRRILILLLIAPFWINYLMRIYSWQGLLQRDGWLDKFLMTIHVIHAPINWLDGKAITVVIGLVYGYLPYMIIPLFGQLDRIPPALLEAGRDLGASPRETFRRVTLPLSKQAILAGLVIVSLPMFGDYFTNNLLGSAKTSMYGNLIDNAVQSPGEGPQAASLVLMLTLFLLLPMFYFLRQSSRARERT